VRSVEIIEAIVLVIDEYAVGDPKHFVDSFRGQRG
jgi:hypothetical protein